MAKRRYLGYLQGKENLMSNKRLSEADKYQAVMDLLTGKGTLGEICSRYGISQTYLYKLRDKAQEAIRQSVSGSGKGRKGNVSREERLESELAEAKQFIGDQALVIEVLKKRR
jgi:transposase-like protein